MIEVKPDTLALPDLNSVGVIYHRNSPVDLCGPFQCDLCMSQDHVSREVEVQQVLDELLSASLLPFALTVGEVTKDADGYTIYLNDSRIRTACVPLNPTSSFKDLVRAAVLARVGRMSGPLKN